MNINLEKLNELVEQGYLRTSEKDNLILYNYTDATVFEKNWTPETRMCRGLVVNKLTGEVVAKPFEKFFNLGEMPESSLQNLSNDVPYVCYEKVDGSLGIIFFNPTTNEWDICTRGSFYSDQAIKGKELLKKYKFNNLPKNTTILVEIIYPENKIVIDYGKQEKLVLLSGIVQCFNSFYEYSPQELIEVSKQLEMELVKSYSYSVKEMIELQKTLPKEKEGFVVRFLNGLRVKIKGDEYCKIHKILSNLSPLSVWDVMENGMVPNSYLQQLPEELAPIYNPIVETLQLQYRDLLIEIYQEFNMLPLDLENTPESKKELGLFLKYATIKHSQAMFPVLLNHKTSVDDYIMKRIRPTGNTYKLI